MSSPNISFISRLFLAVQIFCRTIGNLCTPSRVRKAANDRVQEIDAKIKEEFDQLQKREASLHGISDEVVRAGIQNKIAENRTNLANYESEKDRIQREQDQHAVYWGTCILITILIVILAAGMAVRHAYQNRLREIEILTIENERRITFAKAKQEIDACLAGIEIQLNMASDIPITFDENKIVNLPPPTESQIHEKGEMLERTEKLKVAIGNYNRRIEQLPFTVPFEAAKDSTEKAKSESPFDPDLLNEEALQTANEKAKSDEDKQNVQNLQSEFERVRRVSHQQSFAKALATAKSFLNETDIDKVPVPMEAAREVFDTHKEAMRQEAEAELLAVEREYKMLVQSEVNKRIAGDFAALFDRAEKSYQDATQNPDDPRDELLDTDALGRAKVLFPNITVADQARFSELDTRFTALINNAITQRSQKLLAAIEPLASEHHQIVADNTLTSPQRYDALAKLWDRISELAGEMEREHINSRPVTDVAKAKLDQLLVGVKGDWQEVYPLAITQTVGDLDQYLAELRHVSSLKDFRSPDFLKVLESPASFCFETTRTWNQFVKENASELDTHPPSLAVIEKIFTLINKNTVGLASVPEVVLMKANRKYYEETILYRQKIRSYMMQFRQSYRTKDPYFDSINKKIMDIADSVTSHQQATRALIDLIEQIVRDNSEPACLRLRVAGTLVNELGATHREYLFATTSWRSRYANTLFVTIPEAERCRNKTCSHHLEATKLLADLPMNMLRSTPLRQSTTPSPEPPKELSNRKMAVEYVWVGWVDHSEGNPQEAIIRIKQENIPKTDFVSALYAKLPDSDIMSVIGDLIENKAGIVPVNKKEIRCGTPVYVRRQWVSESKP